MTGIPDEILLERLIMLQRRLAEEPEDVLTSAADILSAMYENSDIPPVRFVLLACVLLGQERGLCFARSKVPREAYESVFPTGGIPQC